MQSIVIYALILFLLMGLLGFLFRRYSVWKYLDLFYYPLGAIGVILIFFMQSDARAILEFSERQQTVIQQLKDVIDNKPSVGDLHISDEFLRISGRMLNTIVRLGNECSGLGPTDQECHVAKQIGPIVEPYVKDFQVYNNEENYEEIMYSICSNARNLFSDIQKETDYSELILKEAMNHYIEGLKKGFQWADIESIYKYIKSFRVRAERRYSSIIPHIEEKYRKFVKEKYDAEIDIATTIMHSFSICMEMPEAITNGEMKIWKEKVSLIKDRKLDIENKVLTIMTRNIKNTPASYFNYLYWPYIIILALALKFAKGVAGLNCYKNDHLKVFLNKFWGLMIREK